MILNVKRTIKNISRKFLLSHNQLCFLTDKASIPFSPRSRPRSRGDHDDKSIVEIDSTSLSNSQSPSRSLGSSIGPQKLNPEPRSMENSSNTNEASGNNDVVDVDNIHSFDDGDDFVSDNQHTIQDSNAQRHNIYHNQHSSQQPLNSSGGHSLISSVLSQIFHGERPSNVCVDGMPVDAIRKLVSRQMSMASQLLLEMLIVADDKSACFANSYKSMMELSNFREKAVRKATLLQINVNNATTCHLSHINRPSNQKLGKNI